jgi:hypothetical protein
MKLQFTLFGIAMLILTAGSPAYAQIATFSSSAVIPAVINSPVLPVQMPAITAIPIPFIVPSAPPVAAISLQPFGIVGQPLGQPLASITNTIRNEPVVVSPLGSITIESLPGFFPGLAPASLNTFSSNTFSSPPVVFQAPLL